MYTFYSRIPEINVQAFKIVKYTGDESGVVLAHEISGSSVVRIDGQHFYTRAISMQTGDGVEIPHLIKDYVFRKSSTK